MACNQGDIGLCCVMLKSVVVTDHQLRYTLFNFIVTTETNWFTITNKHIGYYFVQAN